LVDFLETPIVDVAPLLIPPTPFKLTRPPPREWLKASRKVLTRRTFEFPEILGIEAHIEARSSEISWVLKYFGELPDRLRIVGLNLIVKYGCVRMSEGNVQLQCLFFLLLYTFPPELRAEAAVYINELKASPLFFNNVVFAPNVTLFSDPSNPVIALRVLILRVFESFLDFPDSQDFALWMFEFLCYLLEWPEMFAEFFFFSKPILTQYIRAGENDVTLLRYAAQLLLIQQSAHFVGFEHAPAFRSLTLSTLAEILEKGKATQPFTPQMYRILDVLVDLIYEFDVTSLAAAVLEKFLLMFSRQDSAVVPALFAPIIREIGNCTNESEYMIFGLLTALVPAINNYPKSHVHALR
jgi:hypothetical protein